MSPEDEAQSSPTRLSPVNLSEMSDSSTWSKPPQQNGLDKKPETNGHAKNGAANGFPNGLSETTNGDIKKEKDMTYAWTPLLDIPLKDESIVFGPSNNNDWKESEEINNLRNSMHKSHGNNNGSLMNGKNGIGTEKISEEDPLTGVGKQQTNVDGPSCGIFGCRPKWARGLASTHMFMVVFLLAWILQGMYLTYFVSVITTIEKLFQIKSKTTGMLLSATEIGQICTAMLLTYFAGRGHRPRWIAVGMVIFSIAAFGCSLPHFIFGKQLMQSNELSLGGGKISKHILPYNSSDELLRNFTSSEEFNLCLLSNGTNKYGNESECEEEVKMEQASHSKITLIVLCIFFVSLLSAGVGQTAVSTLGIPYIDDNVASRESPVYLAITIGVRILGPATGFIVGSFCTRIYVDLSNPGIEPTDPKWISAWWLGPVMIGTLMMLASIAMFSFPKQLRGHRIPPPSKIRTVEAQNKAQPVKEAKPKLKDFPKTVRRQLSNDILMFRTASSVFHLLPIAGLYTFLPKYLETQFRLPAADAALITAFGGILVMGVGIIISGIVILKVNPTARWVAGWIAFTALVYSCGMAVLMFVGCNMDDFAGLSKYSHLDLETTSRFEPSCNISCGCDYNKFSPICGADGMTYFSPCHAGCSISEMIDGRRVFSKCGCIPDFTEEKRGYEAISGYCDGNCKAFVLFICLFAFCVFMHSTSEVGSMLLIMRCTDPKDKAMAMGVIQSAIGLFGNVPCPIIYGAVVDSACLVWKTVCGKPGACSLYDTEGFRHYFLGITAVIMFIAFIMDLIVWHKAHRIDIAPTDPKPHATETDHEKGTVVPESGV